MHQAHQVHRAYPEGGARREHPRADPPAWSRRDGHPREAYHPEAAERRARQAHQELRARSGRAARRAASVRTRPPGCPEHRARTTAAGAEAEGRSPASHPVRPGRSAEAARSRHHLARPSAAPAPCWSRRRRCHRRSAATAAAARREPAPAGTRTRAHRAGACPADRREAEGEEEASREHHRAPAGSRTRPAVQKEACPAEHQEPEHPEPAHPEAACPAHPGLPVGSRTPAGPCGRRPRAPAPCAGVDCRRTSEPSWRPGSHRAAHPDPPCRRRRSAAARTRSPAAARNGPRPRPRRCPSPPTESPKRARPAPPRHPADPRPARHRPRRRATAAARPKEKKEREEKRERAPSNHRPRKPRWHGNPRGNPHRGRPRYPHHWHRRPSHPPADPECPACPPPPATTPEGSARMTSGSDRPGPEAPGPLPGTPAAPRTPPRTGGSPHRPAARARASPPRCPAR